MLTKTLTKQEFSGKIQNADVANCLTFQTYQNGRGVAQLGSALGSGPPLVIIPSNLKEPQITFQNNKLLPTGGVKVNPVNWVEM